MFNFTIEWYDGGAEDASLLGLATGSDYGASRGSGAARGGRLAEFVNPGVIMREYLLAAIILLFSLPANAADNGIISKPSGSSVSETLDRLEKVVKAKGLIVFARIDHSTEAEKVGLKLPPTQLLIFGLQ
jgi:hypothetical protein